MLPGHVHIMASFVWLSGLSLYQDVFSARLTDQGGGIQLEAKILRNSVL